MALPRARAEIRAETRKYRQDLKKAEKDTKNFAKQAKTSLISGFKGGFGAIAGLATAGGVADVGGDVIAFEKALARLGSQASGAANLDEIRAAANQMRDELGLSRNKALEAAVQLTNFLGGTAATAENLRVLSNALVGTGAEMEDLAGLAQVMNQQFGLTNPEQLAQGLSSFIAVGKQGSVPLKDMAKVAKQSAAVFKRLGGQGVEGTSQLAAALQIGEQAFGTPAEAATGLKAMIEGLSAATVKVPQLKKAIGQVGTDKFIGLEGALDQLAESKFFKDERLFQAAFPSAPARTMIRALIENRKQFDAFSQAGKQGAKDAIVFSDAEDFVASRGGNLQLQMARLRGKIEDLFTPERIDRLVKGAELLADALGLVVDNIEALVIAFGAYKALQIARLWTKEKAAAGQLAQAQIVLANAYGEAKNNAPKGIVGAPAATTMQKVGAGLEGAMLGFGAGQIIGHGVVASKKATFARQKQKRKRAESETRAASEATNLLLEANLVTAEGAIDPKFLQELRVAQFQGAELTPLQEAAQTALAGFRVAKKASVRGGLGGIKDALADPFRTNIEERKRLVGTGESITEMAKNLQAAQLQAVMDTLQKITDKVEGISERPIEVDVVVDGDKLMTAGQRNQRNRRSPAQ